MAATNPAAAIGSRSHYGRPALPGSDAPASGGLRRDVANRLIRWSRARIHVYLCRHPQCRNVADHDLAVPCPDDAGLPEVPERLL